MSKRSAKLSPVQSQQLRTKLGSIMQLIKKGQHAQANASLQPILRKHAALPDVNHVAAGLSASMHELDRAIYYAQRAVELAPGTPEYLAGLGSILLRADRHDEAIDALGEALRLSPGLTDVLVPLATAQMQSGHIDESRETFTRVLEQNPADLEAANNLALLESDLGHADRAIGIIEDALAHHPEHPLLLDALCMFACYSDTQSPDQVAQIHRRFGQSVQSRVRPRSDHPNTPDPDRRIRVGFVSPDLRTHSIAYFIQPIVEHLGDERFETYLYHTSRSADAMSDLLRDACNTWRACPEGMSQAHKQIAADQIDILIELNGHFAGNVLPLFAARPAPVSATMIGYANTTGLTTIDARLIDEITDPAPTSDAWATETLVRVAGCFLCYRPPVDSPACAEPEPHRPFTFGSFNDLRKMSPACIKAWATILDRCPGSRLMIKTSRLAQQAARDDLLGRLTSHGIDPSRIELIGRTDSMSAHLGLYNQIDCALDTFPYTGTTTTCEAMHMGVPSVTLRGESHAGRVSASLMQAVGESEWVTDGTDAYIQRAVEANAAGVRIQSERESLREALASSSLCDEREYTSKIAATFSTLWKRWCASKGGA